MTTFIEVVGKDIGHPEQLAAVLSASCDRSNEHRNRQIRD
jgi:hypothetical protein